MISRAKSSKQNDDKTNNLDDVILHHQFGISSIVSTVTNFIHIRIANS